MASIFDYETAYPLAEGLQGSRVCNEAIQTAFSLARSRSESVVLEDDDGVYLVTPEGECEEIDENWY